MPLLVAVSVAFGAGLVLALPACSAAPQAEKGSPRGEESLVAHFDASAERTVILSNPRNIGQPYTLERQPSGELKRVPAEPVIDIELYVDGKDPAPGKKPQAAPASAPRIEVYEYLADLTILVRLQDGDLKRPEFPGAGGNRKVEVCSAGEWIPGYRKVAFPLGSGIKSYVLVLESKTEGGRGASMRWMHACSRRKLSSFPTSLP